MTSWLVDKSALGRMPDASDAALWAERLRQRRLGLCTATALELGYSARSGKALRRAWTSAPMVDLVRWSMTPAAEQRAVDVQHRLADRGHHRAPSVADLLVAATAEAHELTVLHVDKDFELIAEVTGQPVERLETTGQQRYGGLGTVVPSRGRGGARR